jgi:seryl-tRNA synthetase
VLDLKFIRQNPEAVRAAAIKKHVECDVDRIIALDSEWRANSQTVDELRSRQKTASKAIGKATAEERPALLEGQQAMKAELKAAEEGLNAQRRELDVLLLTVPSIPSPEVPDGKTDEDNVEIATWGERRTFDFKMRDHIEIGEAQGWLDIETGARLAGSRNYVLRGDLSLLEGAVMRYALMLMVKKGFTAVTVPTLVRPEPLIGTGYFPGGEDQTYRTDERDDLYLVGTSEVSVTALHAGEIMSHEDLPKKYVAVSSCYRREAGTYGKDTKGLYRVHQFLKVEQVVIDVGDEAQSIEHHKAMLGHSEELLQSLNLPYRVVNVCGGDLGGPHVQKFDIETWMPGRDSYGETHSASRFYEFQSRRLNMRYRDKEGTVKLCHTLNNTVAASTRMLIAILENHQMEDGRVAVPEALRPYLDGREVLGQPIG